jgi:hypothetical protein
MIVAHAVHWLVAAPAALVLLWIAVATLVESRRARARGHAVLREDDQPVADEATDVGAASDVSSDG